MAIVNALDIVRVACRQSYGVGGQDIINTIYMQAQSQSQVIDNLILTDIGLAIEQIFDPMRTETSNFLQYTVLEMKNITQDILLGVITWPTFVQGASANVPSSPQIVALTIMRTDKSRVLGRVNWGGVPEAHITDGILTATILTEMANAQAVMLADLVVVFAVYRYIVFNREFGTFRRPNGSIAVVPTRTQRRRSTGIGT